MNRETVALLIILVCSLLAGVGLGLWTRNFGAGIFVTSLVLLPLGYMLAFTAEGEPKDK